MEKIMYNGDVHNIDKKSLISDLENGIYLEELVTNIWI